MAVRTESLHWARVEFIVESLGGFSDGGSFDIDMMYLYWVCCFALI